jgi:hypothetical protein
MSRLFGLSAAVALVCAVGIVASSFAGSADAAPAPITPTPAPSASASPRASVGADPARVPRPTPNHTLTPEGCGAPHGRVTWWIGRVQCHVMDGGAIVAIHRGGPLRKYTGTPTEKEIDYVDANWYTLGAEGYTYLPDEDCANFVSQALKARGWATTAAWHPGSVDWISSTHLRAWVLAHHSATELKGIASFSQVKVGDIAQFDWKNTGIRNHTAIVTKVAQLSDGSWQVWVGEHTDPYEYRNVRTVVTKTHPGATVYFLSLGT